MFIDPRVIWALFIIGVWAAAAGVWIYCTSTPWDARDEYKKLNQRFYGEES